MLFLPLLQVLFHIYSSLLPPPAPSLPPVNVRVTVISSTTAHITWSPPPLEALNGNINHYVIYLEDNSSSVSFNSSMDSYILTGLHPASHYRVGVAAYTVEIGPKTSYTDFVTVEDGKLRNFPSRTNQCLVNYLRSPILHAYIILLVNASIVG